MLQDVQKCYPNNGPRLGTRRDAFEQAWLVFVDVIDQCGQAERLGRGGAGLAILHKNDLEGLAGHLAPTYRRRSQSTCMMRTYDGRVPRFHGGVTHELAHALGVPHPPTCDERPTPATCDKDSIMYTGTYAYPDAYFGARAKAWLRSSSPYVGPVIGKGEEPPRSIVLAPWSIAIMAQREELE